MINIEITSQSAIKFIVHSNNLQIRSLYASDDAIYDNICPQQEIWKEPSVWNNKLLVNKKFK